MKAKILPFIIGVLIGAIIVTIGFYIYENQNKDNEQNGMPSGTPPEITSGGPGNGSQQGGTPPQLPSDSSDSSL